MKHILPLSFVFVIAASTAFGQVLIDKSIDLTGTPGNSRVMGIKEVSDAQDAVSAEVLQKGGLIYASVTGGPNSYTLTFAPAISTPYSEGMVVIFKAAGDNTAAVTLNGIALRKDVSSALAAGDIKDNQIVTVVFDGANFQLASRTTDANSGGTVSSVSTGAANNGVTATWANPTTTPALTIGLGAITPSSVAATGTVTGSNLSGTHTGTSSGTNTGDQTLSGLGGVPTSTTININGNTQDLSANRTWSVGTVTSVSTALANNGVTASWTNATTTPSLTIGLGAITPSSINTPGTITASNFTGSSTGTNTGDQNLSGLALNTRNLTINGNTQNLTADRTWNVGTVTSYSAVGNNGVTTSVATATSTPALTIGLGAITPTSVAATGTVTGSNLSGTHTGTSSGTNTGDQNLSGLALNTRNLTINGVTQNLTADRTWSVGTVTGTGTQNYVAKWNAAGTGLGIGNILEDGTSVYIGNGFFPLRLEVSTPALGAAAGNTTEMFRLYGFNGNGGNLDIRQVRTSAGADWTSAGTRIQQKIDDTYQAYMQFNGTGNTYGLSFGTGGTTVTPGNVVERMKIDAAGLVTVNSLAGAGNRLVYANSSGTLTTTPTLPEWRLVYRDDFENPVSNWFGHTTITGTTGGVFSRQQCNSTGNAQPNNWILSNYTSCNSPASCFTRNIVLKGSYDLTAYPHTEVMVKFTVYYIDSWDGGNERIWAGVSTTNIAPPDLIYRGQAWDVDCCGWPNQAGSGTGTAANLIGLNFSDFQEKVEASYKNSDNTIWLMLQSINLDENPNNESFGIDNVEIYVR